MQISYNNNINTHADKFQTAEQLWFWFIYTKQSRSALSYNRGTSKSRVCELLDVESLITKLYLSGKLTDEQLSVMKKFGDKRRTPHQHIWSENKSASVWGSAMKTIDVAARAKGWLI